MAGRVILVGVGHVFDIAHQVTEIVETLVPKAVALELDKQRLQALLSPPSASASQPFFYRLLANMQQRIARKYGVASGDEMKAALHAAKQNNIGIICIDLDVRYLLEKMWQGMSFKKKVSLICGGLLSLGIGKKRVEEELTAFETEPTRYLQALQTHFPELSSILIDERNEHMAKRLLQSTELYDPIVAFVGEGHLVGLEQLLKDNTSLAIIHLNQLQTNTWRHSLSE